MLIFQSRTYFYSLLIELSGEVEKNPGPSTGTLVASISVYRLVQSDHSSNDKQDDVCVYFKSSLPSQTLSISMPHDFDITTADSKLCNLICLYRFRS